MNPKLGGNHHSMDIESKLEPLLQERLRSMRGDILSTTSHQMRNLMNEIVGMTTLLANGPLTPEQREHAETIARSASTLLELLSAILEPRRGAQHREQALADNPPSSDLGPADPGLPRP